MVPGGCLQREYAVSLDRRPAVHDGEPRPLLRLNFSKLQQQRGGGLYLFPDPAHAERADHRKCVRISAPLLLFGGCRLQVRLSAWEERTVVAGRPSCLLGCLTLLRTRASAKPSARLWVFGPAHARGNKLKPGCVVRGSMCFIAAAGCLAIIILIQPPAARRSLATGRVTGTGTGLAATSGAGPRPTS
jgi:hypothetical protein|eukprot:COSAG01_NODE_2752_length_7143_cov_35.819989_3_plen_188_part_00